jgi:uncharacterized protein (DUF1501 family)
MLINVALQDGFDGDTVVIRVDGAEAYRGEAITTRTQISLAAETQLDVPDGTFQLEVEVSTRGLEQRFEIDPQAQPNVSLSVRGDELFAAFPERLGYV